MTRRPDELSQIILALSKIEYTPEDDIDDMISVEIEEKIQYNALDDAKWIIEEYYMYCTALEKIYAELESDGKLNRNIIYGSINHQYKKELMKLSLPKYDTNKKMEIIRLNSDKLIDNTKNVLIDDIKNADPNLGKRSIDWGVLIIIADAFVKGVILEKNNQ